MNINNATSTIGASHQNKTMSIEVIDFAKNSFQGTWKEGATGAPV